MSIDRQTIDVERIAELRQEHIGRLFLRAHRAFGQRAYRKLNERGHEGLSMMHTALLANLDVNGTRISTIAERADMTKQSMGQLVQDLEEKGYVERMPDPNDRRAVLVCFTDAGWQFLVDAHEVKLEIEAEYSAIVDEEAMAELRSALTQIIEAENAEQSED